jgi:hypothetical protein
MIYGHQLIYIDKHMYLGVSEFTLSGTLEFWSITSRLHVVKVPTIVLRGEFDTMSEVLYIHVMMYVIKVPETDPLNLSTCHVSPLIHV